ncbi:MAG: phosphotransferase [Bacillota bacterium]
MNNNIIIDSSIKLEHIGKIFEILSMVPEFAEKNAQVSAIEILPGGLTNFNFKVTVDGENYALRVAGPGTHEYLDRPAEKYNAQIMSDIEINAPIIYYDEVYGHQVCKYIESKTMHIPDFKESLDYLSKAAKVFRKYHTCGRPFKSDFNPLKEAYVYLNILKEKNAVLYEGSEEMLIKVEEIKAAFDRHPQEVAPCHNDPLCENWLDDGENLWLVDWEYAGNNQPMFDLGALAIEAELSPEKERFLLKEYYGRDITDKEYGLLIINRFLCDALWTYWAVLQIATGKSHEEYWPYGENRFRRAMELVNNGSLDKALAEFK